jgi:hypothetical protein
MKSLSPVPPPPLVLGSESEVLPRPLDPSAEELEPDELDEDEDEEDELELDELLRRLVAAVNAEVAFGAELVEELVEELVLEELEEEVLDGVELVLVLEPEESRPTPVRLPIKRGVMSEAYFAAAVTPVSSKVRSTGPGTTMAVRIADGEPVPPPGDTAGRDRNQRATPPRTRRRTIATSDSRNPRDFLGRGGTTSGRKAGWRGASPGAGRALI